MRRFNLCLLLAFLWLLALTVLSGCGIFRNTKLDKTETRRDSSTVTTQVDKTKELVTDKSTITTTETVTKDVVAPGFEARFTTPANLSLYKNGLDVFEDDRIKVSQALDEQSGALKTNIKVKDRTVPVPLQKQTVEQRNVLTEKAKQTNTKQATQVKQSKKEEHKTTSPNYQWIWYVAGLAALVAAAFYVYKKFF